MTRPGVDLRVSRGQVTPGGEPAGGRRRVAGGPAPWLRRLSLPLALPAVLGTMALAGCGAGHTSLSVNLAVVGAASASAVNTIAANQTIEFVITVTDTGAAGTAGLTVTANLPADFRYTDTLALGGTGVRTSPVDAQGRSQQPTWGVWELSGHATTASINFYALAQGNPGTYTMTATASASTASTTQSNGVLLKLTPAPLLSALISVSPSTAAPGQDITYTVSVINAGTGQASDVSVLVTLPPVFIYDGSARITGNAGRIGGTDALEGSELPYFDGFVVPAQNGSDPGKLTISFDAQVLSSAGAEGSYPVGLQVLGDSGLERVDIPDSAPVQVT